MKKIYFAFILDYKLKVEPLWFKYFEYVSSKLYSLNAHCWKHDLETNLNIEQLDTVENSWRDTLKIHIQFFEDFIKTDCSHLIFCSESCIPVKSFENFFNFLETDISYFTNFNANCTHNFRKAEYKEFIKTNGKFAFAEQFSVLSRKHIEFILSKKLELIKHFDGRFASNEHFSSSYILKEFPTQIKTGVHYIKRDSGTSPKTFESVGGIVFNSDVFFLRKVKENFDYKNIVKNL